MFISSLVLCKHSPDLYKIVSKVTSVCRERKIEYVIYNLGKFQIQLVVFQPVFIHDAQTRERGNLCEIKKVEFSNSKEFLKANHWRKQYTVRSLDFKNIWHTRNFLRNRENINLENDRYFSIRFLNDYSNNINDALNTINNFLENAYILKCWDDKHTDFNHDYTQADLDEFEF